MFAMPSPTRLLLCRVGIVAFCLLPTASVGGWIVSRTSGQFAIAQKAEWQRVLSGRLGMAVEIDAVSYPGHSLASLENVRLLDPETRQLIAKAPAVEVLATDAGWQVQAWQPQIEAARLGGLLRTVEQRLLRETTDESVPCVITARDVTFLDAGAGQTLLNVTAALKSGSEGPAAELAFQLPAAAGASSAPARLLVSRNRRASPPTTLWQLDTAGNPLPASLLAAVLPAAHRLGSHCRFDGSLAAQTSAAGTSGEWQGTLEGVDFDSLVTERFPHQLSGLATIKVQRAALDQGQLTEIRGTIQARDGAISHSLLAAAQEHLRLVLAADNPQVQPGRLVPYRHLALGFALNDRALALTGSADPTQPGILLANAAGPILQAPPQHQAPAISLLRTLLPDNEYQVPATRQTDALIGLLPLPNLAPSAIAERPAAHTPTRLSPTTPTAAQSIIRQPALR
jgi:hypothetical protein